MKYLFLEDFAGNPVPFIFPDRVNHEDMRDQLPYGRVLSAGYVELADGVFRCFGGCADLGTTAKEGDAAALQNAFAPSADIS